MLFLIKYFIFGEPKTAIVKANSEERAIFVTEREYDKEDGFALRGTERIDIIEGIVDSYFE